MYGLDPDTIGNIKATFAKVTTIEKVVLYGSRAKGNDRTGSDIDITLFGKDLSLNNAVYPLMGLLDELYLPYRFDISIFAHIDNAKLIEHINRVGKVLFEKEKGLPEGWEYGVLDDAVKKETSNISLNKIKDNDGDYPVFSAKGFAKNVSFFQQEQEYLAIIKDGAGIGRISKHPAKSSVVATMQYLIPKEGFDIGFIEYFLNRTDFKKYRQGSTIPHIYFKDYKSERFPLLSIAKQQKIVKKLDACFTAINQAKINLEQNLQNTKDLFQSTLSQIFNNQGDDWVVKMLGEVCEILNGGTPKTKHREYWQGDILWLTPKDMGKLDSMYVSKTDRTISELGLQKSSARLIPKNSLILSTRAPIGYLAINTVAMATNQGCRGVIVSKELDNRYLFHFLGKSIELLNKLGTGTTFKELSTNALSSVKIPIPPLAEQQQIVKKLGKLSEQTKTLEQHYQKQLKSLATLKQSLLEKTFKGELVENGTCE